VHVVEKLNKILRAERKLRAELGHEPSSAEIAVEVELSIEEIERIRRQAQTPVSLAKPIGESEDAEFGDLLVDESEQLPEDQVEVTLRDDTLRRLLRTLPTRDREILECRYGLDGRQPSTLDELGRKFNVTRERIRQLENKSLGTLRALARAESFDI
jgi:RNA polymerase primary sigma factor